MAKALETMNLQLGQLSTTITQQQQFIQQVVKPPTPSSSQSTTTTAPKGVVKFRDSAVFKGKANNVESFLSKIDDTVRLSSDSLASDPLKVLYMLCYLDSSGRSAGL
ncbi:hypothetical protein BDN72DRAFT_900762 [Pluteus cervinus]|uniref:Uncharacterized protein n=1 Tax=Pluteus cervinus TaxID=181527 RepID=A0ACD3AIA3_9AGAR|nr:hypothetical protein BDN72DRAFT_900762 [Pluteus cervinus]